MTRVAVHVASRAGAVLLALSASAWAAETRVIEYLSIEANEGGSSGGHVAIRFDDAVYHFQHHAPGVLRLHRDDATDFLFTYSLLQNRGITGQRVAVSDETYALLRSWFNRTYFTQEAEFEALDALHDDRALLEMLLSRQHDGGGNPVDGVRLRSAGYFVGDGDEKRDAPESAALAALRRRVDTVHGADFLSDRRAAVRAALTHLTPAGDGSSFSRRYTDLMTERLALAVLQGALPVRSAALHAPDDEEFVLGDDERAALLTRRNQLADEALHLLDSPRPDWGFPLLVAMARLEAVQRSIDTGRLVFLDSFATDARVVPAAAWRTRPAMMRDLLDEARSELDAARRQLVGAGTRREADVTRLESAANRTYELLRGINEGRDVRVQSGPLLPTRAARRTDLIIPTRTVAEVQGDLAAAQVRERAGEQELYARYAYNLITRNCVSEIFRGIDAALVEGTPDPTERVPSVSRARLGGYIEPGASLTFIPFVSAVAVRDTYNVQETRQLPSLRSRRLAEMYGRENPFVVLLRESNAFTSTVYARNPRDSFFVFFADAVPPRPLLGSVNLVASLGASAAGLVWLPLDGGNLLLSGVKGALFSLPELAFVSLRKGTFDYVERADRPSPAELAGEPARKESL